MLHSIGARRTATFLPKLATTLASALALLGPLAAAADDGEADPKKKEVAVIESGSQVGLAYTLSLEDGTKVETNVGEEALRFEQGSGQIIPGLDKELVGMAVGDTKQVTVSPDEGYGEINPDAFQQVPVSELPEDGRTPGTVLMAQDPEGQVRQLRVHEVEGETATLDFNHPLAGQTLVFDIEILEIQ